MGNRSSSGTANRPPLKAFEFSCPAGKYLMTIEGKAGDAINKLKFKCNDGKESGVYGTDVGSIGISTTCQTGFTGMKTETSADSTIAKLTPMCKGVDTQEYGFGKGKETVNECDGSANIIGVTGTYSDTIHKLNWKCSNEKETSATPPRGNISCSSSCTVYKKNDSWSFTDIFSLVSALLITIGVVAHFIYTKTTTSTALGKVSAPVIATASAS